jgi:integrase
LCKQPLSQSEEREIVRYREPFTVFPRKMKSGRIVWYYQTYDEFDRRTSAHSTGQINKSSARAYCRNLEKENKLVPNSFDNLTFGEFAENWWIPGKCSYLEYRMARKTLSQNYIVSSYQIMKSAILPYFSDYKIRGITRYHAEKWIDSLVQHGLSNSSINIYFRIFHIMLAEAVRREILVSDITEKILYLKSSSKTKGVFSQGIVDKLFNIHEMHSIWQSPELYYANLLSACTGMRISEVLGVQLSDLKAGYISVSKQYQGKIGLQPTKNKKSREIPIPLALTEELTRLSSNSPEGYVFTSFKNRTKPLSNDVVNNALHGALEVIGISKEEQKRQNYTFHSWRHYFNTVMRSNNIADSKLQGMTGHSSRAMTDHYTHFDHTDYEDVGKIQSKILPFPISG